MGKKTSASLSINLEMQEMECQDEMAVAGTCFCLHAGRWNVDMSRAWSRQAMEGAMWSKVMGPSRCGLSCNK